MINPQDLFTISSQKQFEKMALKVFRFQYENNIVYQEFCDFLNTDVTKVKSLQKIPFLPIQFFKSHDVVSTTHPIQETFTSSGTTSPVTPKRGNMVNTIITSKHLVTDVSLYEQSYRTAFSSFYGNKNQNFIANLNLKALTGVFNSASGRIYNAYSFAGFSNPLSIIEKTTSVPRYGNQMAYSLKYSDDKIYNTNISGVKKLVVKKSDTSPKHIYNQYIIPNKTVFLNAPFLFWWIYLHNVRQDLVFRGISRNHSIEL
jgi:hypothetical protein